MAETKRRAPVRYIGDGAYLYGVPARDLTPEEYEEYKEVILASPDAERLYRLPKGDHAAEPEDEPQAESEVTNNG